MGAKLPYRRLSPGSSDSMRLAQAFLWERKVETFELRRKAAAFYLLARASSIARAGSHPLSR